MQAIITGSSCILDYIVLVGLHMPIVQFVTYHVQKVKNVALQNVTELSITPMEPDEWSKEERHMCSLTLIDGSHKSFDVAEHENGKFRAGTSWEIKANAK